LTRSIWVSSQFQNPETGREVTFT